MNVGDHKITPREALDARLKEIGGCTNGGCYVVRPKGQHTNGPCHCLEHPRKALMVISAYQACVAQLERENG